MVTSGHAIGLLPDQYQYYQKRGRILFFLRFNQWQTWDILSGLQHPAVEWLGLKIVWSKITQSCNWDPNRSKILSQTIFCKLKKNNNKIMEIK